MSRNSGTWVFAGVLVVLLWMLVVLKSLLKPNFGTPKVKSGLM